MNAKTNNNYPGQNTCSFCFVLCFDVLPVSTKINFIQNKQISRDKPDINQIVPQLKPIYIRYVTVNYISVFNSCMSIGHNCPYFNTFILHLLSC